MEAAERKGSRAAEAFGTVALAALFVWLCRWSWRKWPDPLIDFGVELYVPQQLALGKALYRDIACKNGPLSLYVNALWFRIFGASLSTLIYCNLAILAAITVMIHRIFAKALGYWAGFAACATFLTVFGFSQYVNTGNYNYVCPYSHDQTHGVALAAALILALGRHAETRRAGPCGLAGLFLGLLFLTKIEFFVPAAFVSAIALLLVPPTSSGAAAFCCGLILPAAAGWALLASRMDPRAALRGLLGNWLAVGDYSNSPFYRSGMGFDDIRRNLGRIYASVSALIVVLSAAVGIDFVTRRWRARIGLYAAAAIAAFVTSLTLGASWPDFPQALPVVALFCSVVLTAACLARKRQGRPFEKWVPLLLWAWLSLGLLGKMILNARLFNYGFVLAMPAALLLIVCLLSAAPIWLRREFGIGATFGALMAGFGAAGALACWRASDRIYARKTYPLGSGPDMLWTFAPKEDPAGARIAELVGKLETMPPETTAVVMPEGEMVNYLSHRRNPTPYNSFFPVDVAFFGGQYRVIQTLRAASPDVLLVVKRDLSEFGVGDFGSGAGNGDMIAAWVRNHYRCTKRTDWYIVFEPLRARIPTGLARKGP